MNSKLIIIGAGGHGKVVADIAIKMDEWRNISFLDDDESIQKTLGLDVIGKTDIAFTFREDADFFVAIGNNYVREEMLEKLLYSNLNVVTLIHPNAVIGTDVKIGIGTVIMAGVVINSSTSVGKGCIINTNSSIDHDNTLGNFIHVSPRVSTGGNVRIENNTWIGIGSVISNNVNICSECIIGAGSVVLHNVYESGTYVGNKILNGK